MALSIIFDATGGGGNRKLLSTNIFLTAAEISAGGCGRKFVVCTQDFSNQPWEPRT